jgi:hypothetical protein
MDAKSQDSLLIPWSARKFANSGQNARISESEISSSLFISLFRSFQRVRQRRFG